VKCAIAAQDEQGIHFQLLDSLYDLIRNVNRDLFAVTDHLAGIGISAIRRAEDRPAARQNPAHILHAQRNDPILIEKTVVSVFYTQHFKAIFIDRGLHRGADNRIKTRRIPAACKNSDSFHQQLLYGNTCL
jgi:hypothetical protein